MRTGKSLGALVLVASLGFATQPAYANSKDKSKRSETSTGCTESCKPAIRSMSESTPARKTDCPKIRRILM